MKKRKPPIILGSMLLALLGGIFVFGAMQSQPAGKGDGHNHPEEVDPNKVTGESTTAPSAGDLHERMVARGGGTTSRPPEDEDPNKEPSILEPDYGKYKPTPSESATSARWYDDESQHNKGN